MTKHVRADRPSKDSGVISAPCRAAARGGIFFTLEFALSVVLVTPQSASQSRTQLVSPWYQV